MITIDTIRRHACRTPARPALIDGAQALTWDEFESQVSRASAWLTHHLSHSSQGEPVRAAVLTDGHIPAVVLTAALTTLGVPWVVLDPAGPPDRLSRMLEVLRPTLIATQRGAALVPAATPGNVRIDLPCSSRPTRDEQPWSGTQLQTLTSFTGPPAAWDAPPFTGLGFTSGTTGTPKLVIRTRAAEARRLAMLQKRYGFDAYDTHLVTVPLSHASSHGWARVFLAVGATVVLGDADARHNMERITRHRVRTTLMVPQVLEAFVIAAEQQPHRDLSSLRFLLSGGRHLPRRLVQRTDRRLGSVLHTYYGTTETGIPALADPADLVANPRSSGRPVEGCSVRVVNLATGIEVPPGAPGQVVIAGYMNADRYVTGPLSTLTLDGQDHFITADIGRRHPDGSIELLGRTDEHLDAATAGDLIGLEDQLRALPGVSAAAVTVLPDPTGSIVLATLVVPPLHAGERHLLAAAHRLARESGCRATFQVVTTTALPFNRTGKIDLAAVTTLSRMHRHPERAVS